MTTHWIAEVQTRQNGRKGTSMATGNDTLEGALTAGVRDASYYCLCCGYDDITIEITETCTRCSNEGRVSVRRPRSTKTIRCPDCRGKVPTGHVGPFPFELHDNAEALHEDS